MKKRLVQPISQGQATSKTPNPTFENPVHPSQRKVHLTQNTLILILAGVDTVGNSLLYTLWLISQDQRVQTKLRQELQFLTSADELSNNTTYLKVCLDFFVYFVCLVLLSLFTLFVNFYSAVCLHCLFTFT